VKARWQPQVRAKARKKAATTGGIVIDTRAQPPAMNSQPGITVGHEDIRVVQS
jgi:hypothetical protein